MGGLPLWEARRKARSAGAPCETGKQGIRVARWEEGEGGDEGEEGDEGDKGDEGEEGEEGDEGEEDGEGEGDAGDEWKVSKGSEKGGGRGTAQSAGGQRR